MTQSPCIYVAQIAVGPEWVDAPDPSMPDGFARYDSMEAAAAAPRDPSLTYRLVKRRNDAPDEPLTGSSEDV